jgi:hypothetical protein
MLRKQQERAFSFPYLDIDPSTRWISLEPLPPTYSLVSCLSYRPARACDAAADRRSNRIAGWIATLRTGLKLSQRETGAGKHADASQASATVFLIIGLGLGGNGQEWIEKEEMCEDECHLSNSRIYAAAADDDGSYCVFPRVRQGIMR